MYRIHKGVMSNEYPCNKCEDNKFFIDYKDMKKMVDHPTHYNREGSIECIDEMILIYGKEATMNFCLLSAHKYRYRAGQKWGEDAMKDLKKSDWYIAKYAELKERNENNGN